MEPGSRIWVSDVKEGWVLATVESRTSKLVTATLRSGDEVQRVPDVDAFSCLGTEPGSLRAIDDLTRLPALHEPALLQTLQERFDKDEIYTWVGPILIAVNPFKKIPGLYTTKRWISREKNLPPHIYGLSDAAYRAMVDFKGEPQTILVSGESGAGKTETSKHAMQYFTECSHSGGDVSAKILQANPLLECFGNAKTVRNDNSSRFGKLIEMRFSDDGRAKLHSAGVTSYLLEKARIVHQARGERNYHVFYEIFQHPSSSGKYKLSSPQQHNYSNASGEFTRADVKDSEQLERTLEATKVLGFSAEDMERVFEIVAAVIHLGDVQFKTEKGGEACSVANPEKLRLVADLLGLAAGSCSDASFTKPSQTLADVLCVRRMNVSGGDEVFVKTFSPQLAEEARDALAMSIYERLFAWIVWRVNHAMGGKVKSSMASKDSEEDKRLYTIGILDIFGFEVFQENYFEQLCINYANEQLQRQFNEHVFELEQKMYEREGVDWTFVSYPDNSPTINMIESKPIGLLALVDEECIYPNGSDRSLHSKLVQNLKQFDRFSCPQNQARDFQFSVKHFAGEVTYTIEGFYRKNKNELRQDAVDLICSSNKFLVRVLLPPDAQEAAGGADAAKYFAKRAEQLTTAVLGSPSSSAAREWEKKPLPEWETSNSGHNRVKSARKMSQIQQTTVSSAFKSQLHSALTLIRASKPSFVRCVKPNDKNKPSIFVRTRVLDQLRYSGVVEVIRVARAGYPTRFDLDHFLDRYGCLVQGGLREARRLALSGNVNTMRSGCEKICSRAGLKQNTDYQCGKTKVFLRAEATVKVETAKGNMLRHSVRVIQKAWRRYYSKNRLGRAARKIQRLWRGYRIRKRAKPLLQRRRVAAEFIHSSPNFRRWVGQIRKRLRENPGLRRKPAAKAGLEFNSKDFSKRGDEEAMQQLIWISIPVAILFLVPTLASSSPTILGLVLLAALGAALGSFLVMDAQRNGQFSSSALKETRVKTVSKAKSMVKKSINSAPLSPRRQQAAAFLSNTTAKVIDRSRRPMSGNVEIQVNGEALRKFAGLAATKRKEAMDRARAKAEDMLLAGQLTKKPVPTIQQPPQRTSQLGTTKSPRTSGLSASPRASGLGTSSTAPPVTPPRPATSPTAAAKASAPMLPSNKPSFGKAPPSATKTTSPPALPPGKPRADTSKLDAEEQYTLNKAILSMFLEEQVPDQMDMADDLLKEFEGKEEVLFDKLTEEFPDVNVLHSSKSADTPVWDKFIKKKSSRRHNKQGSRGSRGFFGTIGSASLEEELRAIQDASNRTASSVKKRVSVVKKKTESSAKSMFSKLGM